MSCKFIKTIYDQLLKSKSAVRTQSSTCYTKKRMVKAHKN
jgi:hypothetical protein